MSLIKNLDHAYSVVASDAVKAARVVEGTVIPALRKANAAAPTIEAVTALISPNAAAIERTAFDVLGRLLAANDAAVAAEGAKGLNVTLDQVLIEDLKAIGAMLKPQATALVAPAPASK